MTAEPECVQIRAVDVRPYHYGVWCTVGGGELHTNPIVAMKWSEDGTQIVFMLDSHNFMFEDPNTVLELVPLEPSAYAKEKYGAWHIEPQIERCALGPPEDCADRQAGGGGGRG